MSEIYSWMYKNAEANAPHWASLPDGDVLEVQEFIRKFIQQAVGNNPEPNPVRVALIISEVVGLRFHDKYAYAVEVRARDYAKQVGDWCGGYYDPMDVVDGCLGIKK